MDSQNEPLPPLPPGGDASLGLDRRRPLVRVDLSVNIPTIMAIIGCVTAVCSFGLGIYRDLDNRQLRTDIAVVDIRTRLEKTEAALGSARGEQLAANQALRGELRSEIGEIKGLLNSLILGGPPVQRQRQLDRDWSK